MRQPWALPHHDGHRPGAAVPAHTRHQQLEGNERNYAWLFGVNVLVAALLLGCWWWNAWLLFAFCAKGALAVSRLLVKLAAIFALVGLLMPGVLTGGRPYQPVTRSIEAGFDVKVEGALVAGGQPGSGCRWSHRPPTWLPRRVRPVPRWPRAHRPPGLALERIWDQLAATDGAAVECRLPADWQRRGSCCLNPERPTALLRSVREQQAVTQIEGPDDIADPNAVQMALRKVLVLVTNPGLGLLTEPRFCKPPCCCPRAGVQRHRGVREANREYQSVLARGGCSRMYVGTLTLSLFLAVFAAVLLAVFAGNQLARPLLVLAEGVRGGGRRQPQPESCLCRARMNFVGLTRSFAMMTQQLADARAAVEQNMVRYDARSNLQTIRDNLTAGVIVLGRRDGSSTPALPAFFGHLWRHTKRPTIVRSAWAG